MTDVKKIESDKMAEAAYKASLDQLRFMKQQQWIITNYIVLVLASIFAIGRAFSLNSQSLLVSEKVLGTGFAVITFVFGLFLLIEIQRDIGNERIRHGKIVDIYVSEADRANLDLGTDRCPFSVAFCSSLR